MYPKIWPKLNFGTVNLVSESFTALDFCKKNNVKSKEIKSKKSSKVLILQ
jgi:hypothetical protein